MGENVEQVYAAYVALWGLLGALFGALAVPELADWVLKLKLKRMRAWWSRAGALWRDWSAANPGRVPDPGARGDEGAAGIWLEEVSVAVQRGTITVEQAEKARGFGVVVEEQPTRTDAADDARYRFEPEAPARAALALALGAAFAMTARAAMPLPAAGLLVLVAALVALCVICDVRARVIPLELCGLLALAGLAVRLVLFGATGALTSLASGAAAAALCLGANALFKGRADGGRALGLGDVRMMVALAILCGPRGSILGAAVCYGAALAVSAVLLAARRAKLSDAVPMAPFLALWALVGTAVALSAFAT